MNNTANQITDLLKITGRLIGVLEREIEVLRAMQPAEIEALQQDKIALSAAYEAQIKSFAGQPGILEAVQPALKTELEKAIEMFQSTLAANERALRAAKNTTQRVLEAIAEEIENSNGGNNGYSATGHHNTTVNRGHSAPVSLAYDQRL